MNKEDLLRLLPTHGSQRKIAAALGTSVGRVRYWLGVYNLTTIKQRKPEKLCKRCRKALTNRSSIYCSDFCHKRHTYEKTVTKWKRGELKGYSGKTAALASWLRRYMLEKADYACQECGWNKRHPVDGKPLVEIDHIDGVATNCEENNLRVLCPNCHSMTPTFRARNKNSCRTR